MITASIEERFLMHKQLPNDYSDTILHLLDWTITHPEFTEQMTKLTEYDLREMMDIVDGVLHFTAAGTPPTKTLLDAYLLQKNNGNHSDTIATLTQWNRMRMIPDHKKITSQGGATEFLSLLLKHFTKQKAVTELKNGNYTAGLQQLEASGIKTEAVEKVKNVLVENKKIEEPVIGLDLQKMSDIEKQSVKWLWPNMIPRGGLTVIAGEGETGKSTMVSDLITRMVNGTEFPDGSFSEPVEALYVGVEEDVSSILKPRLEAFGANQDRIYYSHGFTMMVKGKKVLRPFTFGDVAQLRKTLTDNPEIKVVIFDPIGVYFGEKDSYKDAEMQQLLQPLNKLSHDLGVTMLAIAHLNKGETRSIRNRIMGSVAIVNTARCVIGLVRDKLDITKTWMGIVKCNYGGRRTSQALSTKEGMITWMEEMNVDIERWARGIQDGNKSSGPQSDDRDMAKTIIKESLASGEWVEASVIEAACLSGGIGKTTLHRATEELNVQKMRTNSFPAKSMWRLVDDRPF